MPTHLATETYKNRSYGSSGLGGEVDYANSHQFLSLRTIVCFCMPTVLEGTELLGRSKLNKNNLGWPLAQGAEEDRREVW